MSAKALFVLSAAVALGAVGVGCGSSSNDESGGGGTKVAIVLPGPINDKGFNETGYDGLQDCKKAGAETSYAEKVPPAQFVSTMKAFAAKNDLVIGHGIEFGKPVSEVAPEFADTDFTVTSSTEKQEAKNALGVSTNNTQGAYLAGVVAGLATKSNKIAAVAGLSFLKPQMEAYEQGAKSVNPKVETKVVYLGTFEDVARGREAAQGLASDGYDVVFHIADAAGVGVINGAQASGIKAIGWGKDQHSLAPSTVIASEIVNQAAEIGKVCEEVIDGSFKGGLQLDGLHSGLVGISKLYGLPASATTKVEEVKKGIEEGSITPPELAPGVPSSGPEAG